MKKEFKGKKVVDKMAKEDSGNRAYGTHGTYRTYKGRGWQSRVAEENAGY